MKPEKGSSFVLQIQPNRKKFEKSIAMNWGFDNFLAPRRPKGRQDSMFANR
jgi:hypothetical protein